MTETPEAVEYWVGDRVQRKGWQLSAMGTVRAALKTSEYPVTIYIIEWDFRGMQKDYTTAVAADLLPAHVIPSIESFPD